MLVSGNETKLEDVVKEMKGEIEEVVKESKEEIKEEISGVKNETSRVLHVLENVVNASKTIAWNQQHADELREVNLRQRLLEPPYDLTLGSRQRQVRAFLCEYQRLLSVKKLVYILLYGLLWGLVALIAWGDGLD